MPPVWSWLPGQVEMTMFATDWLPVIIEVSAITIGLIAYILHWKVRGRLQRIRCAKMLLTELDILIYIAEQCHSGKPDDARFAIERSGGPLPHDNYDGLVNSANISYFTQPLQRQLRSLYNLIDIHNYNRDPTHTDKMAVLDSNDEPKFIPIEPELRKARDLDPIF